MGLFPFQQSLKSARSLRIALDLSDCVDLKLEGSKINPIWRDAGDVSYNPGLQMRKQCLWEMR
jgi:hypothetical protein